MGDISIPLYLKIKKCELNLNEPNRNRTDRVHVPTVLNDGTVTLKKMTLDCLE